MRNTLVAVMGLFLVGTFLSAPASAAERSIELPGQGISLELPDRWIKVPKDVFRKKMRPLKKAYAKSGSEKRFDYDCAVQLESRDWFRYPYLLINIWEDTRVDSDEISQMNQKIEENLLSGDVGINGTELVSSSYNSERHFYRAEVRFSIKDKQMMLLKGVCYLNQSVLQLSAYMPREMYPSYAPDIRQAMDSLQISPDRVYRASQDRWLEFEDVVPYLKVLIATLVAFAVAGFYVWLRRSGTGG
jgi:hypothetical protein